MRMVVILAYLVVSACASAKETYLPDGRLGYSISCDGSAVGINVCFEKAGSLCGSSGYDIYSRDGQTIPTAVATPDVVTFGAFNTKSILIACRS